MDKRGGIPILYEDNHLLVVVKPPGMPTQRDASGDQDLLTRLKAYVGEKYQKPGAVYLGLVHRLDRPVGGVMVVARTSKAAARLSEQVRERRLSKRYLAVVHGQVPVELSLTDYLLKDERSGMVAVVPEGTAGAKLAQMVSTPLGMAGAQDERGAARLSSASLEAARAQDERGAARLSLASLEAEQAQDVPGAAPMGSAPLDSARPQRGRASGMTLMVIRLITGRAHQIRVQHAHAGYPLVGDQRYGIGARAGKPQDAGMPIALWAAGLGFEHPTKREPMVFFAPPNMSPEMTGVWQPFQSIIATLTMEGSQ